MRRKSDSVNYWPAFSDVSIGLFFILMVALVVLIMQRNEVQEEMKRRYAEIKKMILSVDELRQKEKAKSITIKPDGFDIKITFGSDILFNQMDYTLLPRGNALLLVFIDQVLKKLYDRRGLDVAVPEIQVEGHTDSDPINDTGGYIKSNWELSAARAITVVKLIQSRGIQPDEKYRRMLSAKGYSQYNFIDSDRDAQGRLDAGKAEQNRRIEIILHFEENKLAQFLQKTKRGM